jgi:isochorismate synthase/2-succinyl-5-enolpyruvyl-6-hydroxy-3-cyclohexene-1-carboxylate synthase/2-succinyl-6-hydroxy-2,4-cyclohexadiene-1-carboxylate synthase/O-succinylbenzoate synthase
VLQLRHVQHICIPFSATLTPSDGMHHSVRAALSLLHPTPAVCGTPSAAARRTIRELERFDRGFYAGPLGYLSSDSCEFCVGIRSALVRGAQASIFAGAGIVRGSTATSEWEEVHVKMKNFVSLFPCASHLTAASAPPSPFMRLPNLNAVYAALLIEELLRSGLGHVVMCPGSRCAPLTVAVARSGCPHSLATDERGAGFMALGFARASGRCAAVVVSSGTAVANLLPAVIEASYDHVPLLLLTADRPAELRDTAANQTVNQVAMLGSTANLRWFKDLPCPSVEAGVDSLLSDASYALACATGATCGPVHLNIMLREPLAPNEVPWPRDILTRSKRVSSWLHSRQPFTTYLRPYRGLPLAPDAQLLPVLAALRNAQRGVVVAGSMFLSAQQRATVSLARHLGWPVLPDVCSGVRSSALQLPTTQLAPMYDLLLAHEELTEALEVDVVLQAGGRIISKRLQVPSRPSNSSIPPFLAPDACMRLLPRSTAQRCPASAYVTIASNLCVGCTCGRRRLSRPRQLPSSLKTMANEWTPPTVSRTACRCDAPHRRLEELGGHLPKLTTAPCL